MALEILTEQACFGGVQGYYRHEAKSTGLPMRFSVYRPPQAKAGKVPVLFYLAGLTCTEETFMAKAGAQRVAARLGVMLVSCDTSPRNTGIAGEAESWDFGTGAGFYLNATRAPWSKHFRMYDYVLHDLREAVLSDFSAKPDRLGIFGHSMGGHGALVLALRNPAVYRSVSAFAPICAPGDCAWGHKAFTNYLGEDRAEWAQYDATRLVESGARAPGEILIDQGLDDKFLAEGQLLPESFERACVSAGQKHAVRRQPGYDHSYYFIATFMEQHLEHHARQLGH